MFQTALYSLYLPTNNSAENQPLSIIFITHKKVKVARIRLPSVCFPVLGSQPAGDVSHKPDGRLPLLFARPAVTLATLKSAATNFAAW